MQAALEEIGVTPACTTIYCVAGSSQKSRTTTAEQLAAILERFDIATNVTVVGLSPTKEIQILFNSINLPIMCWSANHFIFPIFYFAGEVFHMARLNTAGAVTFHLSFSLKSRVNQTNYCTCAHEAAAMLLSNSFVFVTGEYTLDATCIPFGEPDRLPQHHAAQCDFWTTMSVEEMNEHSLQLSDDNIQHLWALIAARVSAADTATSGRLLIGNPRYIQSSARVRSHCPLITRAQLRRIQELALQSLPMYDKS